MATFDYTFYMIQHINEPSTHNYVGSSKHLPARILLHKSDCYNETRPCYNSKIYQTMRQNGGFDAFQVVELEHHNMTDNDAHQHEQQLIQKIKPTMNTIKAWTGLSIEEYHKQHYKENFEKIKEHKKHYQTENAEKIKEYYKQYYKENTEKIKDHKKQKHTCECGGKYTNASKSTHLKTEKHKTCIANQHYKRKMFNRFITAIKT